jgi:hypothetical protein
VKWLALAAVVCAWPTAAAASGNVSADRDQASAAAVSGPDTDHDGLPDDLEARRYHTDPLKRDTDRDGLNDGAEVLRYHTSPRTGDTDRDGLSDREEVRRYRTDPRRRDTDKDGLPDVDEIRRYRTNSREADTDRDGLDDGAELRRYKTDPRRRDTDHDGLYDGDEVSRYRTNPLQRDTDGDKYGDRIEVKEGKDPLSPRSRPGFPGADTTGVPSGTVLTPYTGPSTITTPDGPVSTITTPNTVIDGKTMGCVVVQAPGVVIRNSKISCTGFYAILNTDEAYTGTPLLLEDSEIDCQNTRHTAISDTNFIARRLNVHGCENGFNLNQNVVIEDSYIHDLYNDEIAHTDGIQFGIGHFVDGQIVPGVLNITIRHNTIYSMGVDGSFGTSAIISNRTPNNDHNVLIENNLMAGGAYTLYCDQDGATGVNYRVVNNHFSRRFSPKVGFWGPSADCADETQSGNVIHETGQPLKLE